MSANSITHALGFVCSASDIDKTLFKEFGGIGYLK